MKHTIMPRAQHSVPRRSPQPTAATITLKESNEPFGPSSNGILMTPEEFDRADPEDFDEGWGYEIINGVLIVSPIPFEEEADPNEELGYLLRRYQDDHPQGSALNKTLQERYVPTKNSRCRPDRVIWAGLGRHPRRKELPTVIVEFVSKRKRDRVLDYETKRDEYRAIKIKEYWIIDRFLHTMTVFSRVHGKNRITVIQKDQVYKTDLLPGFELPLARLFALAAEWGEREPEWPIT
jgi:Uma2 family endonuclease